MTLRLLTDTTPAGDASRLPHKATGVKYSFRVELHTNRGITVFTSSWFFGDEQRIEEHLEQVEIAFAQADRVEVVR